MLTITCLNERKDFLLSGKTDFPSDEIYGLDKAKLTDELVVLKKTVDRLSKKLKEAIVLHYFEQLSIAEAATVANIRIGTFKSRLARALESLREELGQKLGDL